MCGPNPPPPVPFQVVERCEAYVNYDDQVLMDDNEAEILIAQFDCAVVGRLLGRRLPHIFYV